MQFVSVAVILPYVVNLFLQRTLLAVLTCKSGTQLVSVMYLSMHIHILWTHIHRQTVQTFSYFALALIQNRNCSEQCLLIMCIHLCICLDNWLHCVTVLEHVNTTRKCLQTHVAHKNLHHSKRCLVQAEQ